MGYQITKKNGLKDMRESQKKHDDRVFNKTLLYLAALLGNGGRFL